MTMQLLTSHQTRETFSGYVALCGAKDYPTWLPHTSECAFHDGKSACNCTVTAACEDCVAAKKAAIERRAAKAKGQLEAQAAKTAGMDGVKIYD